MKPRTYEELRSQLDTIINEYWQRVKDLGYSNARREEALDAIRKLGFTEGDAERWLDKRRRRN